MTPKTAEYRLRYAKQFVSVLTTADGGDAHVTIKVPCYDNGTSKVTLMVGVKPDFKSVELERIAENGTLDGEPISLYITGCTCLYHADIPAGTVDIALLNTSNETLAFDADGGMMQLVAYG
jgi:hypothetical protein